MMRSVVVVVALLLPLQVQLQQLNCAGHESSQKIQVMFLLDQTGSFAHNFQHFSNAFNLIADDIHHVHSDPEFGVSLFGNWESDTWYGKQPTPYGCYKLEQSMSADILSVGRRIADIQPKGGKDYENALAALAFAGADEQAGWLEVGGGGEKEIRKFIVLLTDSRNKWVLTNRDSRKAFKGDGTDTCDSSFNPSYSDIRKVLRQRDINVIGFYSNETVMQFFDDEFWSVGVPYCAGHFYDNTKLFTQYFEDTVNNCIRDVLRCIKDE